MTKLYLAFIVRHDENHRGTPGEYYDGGIILTSDEDNILARFNIRGITSARVFTTQKAAVATVLRWREEWKTHGIYYWEG